MVEIHHQNDLFRQNKNMDRTGLAVRYSKFFPNVINCKTFCDTDTDTDTNTDTNYETERYAKIFAIPNAIPIAIPKGK